MRRDRSLRTTFDSVAALYDEARPGYPESLVEDVLWLSAIPPGGSILEIGCGPAKATLPFARRGYSMLCLELGENLAALAAEHCRPYPAVEIQNIAFEDWPLLKRAFDLVISAGAFHWIAPEIGFSKAAAALKDTGSIALFWNYTPGVDTPFRRAVKKVYQERAPQLAQHLPGSKSQDALVSETVEDINASGLFGEVVVKRYPWAERYTAERYIKLLNTFSRIRSLEKGVRQHLLAGVRETVERFGGVVESHNITLLYLARLSRSKNALRGLPHLPRKRSGAGESRFGPGFDNTCPAKLCGAGSRPSKIGSTETERSRKELK